MGEGAVTTEAPGVESGDITSIHYPQNPASKVKFEPYS